MNGTESVRATANAGNIVLCGSAIEDGALAGPGAKTTGSGGKMAVVVKFCASPEAAEARAVVPM